jgi:hypothetical protein
LAGSANLTFNGTALTVPTLNSPAATALTIQSAGTTAMTIDTSQRVGIGTTSPLAGTSLTTSSIIAAGYVSGQGSVQLNGSSNTTNSGYVSLIMPDGTRGGYFGFIDTANSTGLSIDNDRAGPIRFLTTATEVMRIDANGNLLVGQTSDSLSAKISATSGVNTSHFITTGSANSGVCASLERNSTGLLMNFRYSGADISGASISTTGGTSVAYNTGSDYRLKNNVQTMTSGIATINALHPVTYKWNLDGSDGAGFIAHELAEHIPLAVTGVKDAINEDGSIKPQGVDYSKIVVHLVAAIQEISAKNDALTTRIATLEANAPKVA